MTEAVFEKHVGSLFTMYLYKNNMVFLRLDKVNHVGVKTAPDQTEKPGALALSSIAMTAFSLVFDSNNVEVPQDSYLVDHGVLGRFTMFLVPGLALSGKKTCIAYFSSFKQA
ncbi:DUF6916 family protein [Granulicella arctica]|uniref:DUF6916 family protein n=1 Tax=Granulicella arctica TaxID=940613 RepID=UPI0021E060E1|nr:hypothetical protein [Granulicella arctica]